MTIRPDRYRNAIVPHIYVDRASDGMAFYTRAFGAVELFRVAHPNGKIVHAEVSISGSVFMIGDPDNKVYSDPRLQSKELEVKVDFKKLKEDYAHAKQGEGGNVEILKRMGALSLTASTVSESERRKVVASQLPAHVWPEHKIFAVAVDTESGERRVFDRTAGVHLIDAMAASCAAPGMSPPITIEGHRYMDGGCYSIDNADLADGFDRVLILTLKAGVPPSCVVSLEAALETLQHNGAKVVVVRPDEATEAAFAAVGGNLLDPSVREGAARAGWAQGRRMADLSVASLWQ